MAQEAKIEMQDLSDMSEIAAEEKSLELKGDLNDKQETSGSLPPSPAPSVNSILSTHSSVTESQTRIPTQKVIDSVNDPMPPLPVRKENDMRVEVDRWTMDESHRMCSICLCEYDDGDVLRRLFCNHHFHAGCIDKWLLRENCTRTLCPICKEDVLRGKT
jgi:hypothetical protein